MALTYVPAARIPASDQTTKHDDNAFYWKRLQQLAVFQEPGAVSSVAFCPKKPYTIATTSSVRLSLYDTVICEPVNMFSRFKQAVFGARFRKDGSLVAIGGEEGKMRIFDVASGTGTGKAPLRSVKASSQSLKVVDFSHSGRSVFSMADDGLIKQWDLAGTGTTPTAEISAHSDAIRAGVVSSYNDNIIVSGGYDHKIKLWDLRNAAGSEASLEIDCGAPVETLIYLPSENLLASASTNIIKIWDISAGGRQLASIQQHHKTITSLALGTNGTYLLSGAIDRRINVFNLSNYTLTYSMSMASPVLGLAMSADDSMMAVGMGSLLAIHRRAPLKDVLTATKYKDSKAVRKTITQVEVKERGEELKKEEIVAQQAQLIKLDRVDRMLKKYQHGSAVKTMFSLWFVKNKREQIPGYLRVIIHRRAIHAALAGQDQQVVAIIARYLYENLVRNNYFDILRHVAVAMFEVYGEEQLDAKTVHQMSKLKDCLARELVVQKQICQSIGILEMVLNASADNHQNEQVIDSSGVFGDVTVSIIPLPLENGSN